MAISKPWAECKVKDYVANTSNRLTSLRKQLNEHGASKMHLLAQKILAERCEGKIQKHIGKVHFKSIATSRAFRTAYMIAKTGCPFTDHPKLISFQKLNGVYLGRILHFDVICNDIDSHISSEMKRKLVSLNQRSEQPISVMLDESTSLSKKSCFIVYLRSTVSNKQLSFFLELVQLPNGTASAIWDTLLSVLADGFMKDYLTKFWLGIMTDGCSTMFGWENGLVALLRNEFPCLLNWNCSAHRVELAVRDALDEMTATNSFKIFFDKVYFLYSMSPTNQRELEAIASSLNTN